MADSDPILFTRGDAERIKRVVARIEKDYGTDRTGARQPKSPAPTETLFARLADRNDDDPALYSWAEVNRIDNGDDPSTWEILTDGRTATYETDAAFSIQGAIYKTDEESEDSESGDVVLLRRAMVDTQDGTSHPFKLRWCIVSPIPGPTARYQVYTPIDDTIRPIWTAPRFCDTDA